MSPSPAPPESPPPSSTGDEGTDIAEQSAAVQEKKNICFQQYKGQCTKAGCDLLHNLRLPKELEPCSYYAHNGHCGKQQSCLFMHAEFPCKYYYLGVKHPTERAEKMCWFLHGDAIEREELTNAVIADALQSKVLGEHTNLNRLQKKFEARSQELPRRRRQEENTPIEPTPSVDVTETVVELPNDSDGLETIIGRALIQELARHGIHSVEQIVALPVVKQRAHGLSIDQIHLVHLKALQAGKLAFAKSSVVRSMQNVEAPKVQDESFSSLRSLDEEPDFLGFTMSSDMENAKSVDELVADALSANTDHIAVVAMETSNQDESLPELPSNGVYNNFKSPTRTMEC